MVVKVSLNVGEESQLEKHNKTHKKFECDDCDSIFKREGTLEKHVQAAHEDVTLFCHYFNNGKDCPYEDECIFVHEESDVCKFGNGCERLLCMYQHEDGNDDDDDSESEDDSDSDDESAEINVEELKPVLGKLAETFEKLSVTCANLKQETRMD